MTLVNRAENSLFPMIRAAGVKEPPDGVIPVHVRIGLGLQTAEGDIPCGLVSDENVRLSDGETYPRNEFSEGRVPYSGRPGDVALQPEQVHMLGGNEIVDLGRPKPARKEA